MIVSFKVHIKCRGGVENDVELGCILDFNDVISA